MKLNTETLVALVNHSYIEYHMAFQFRRTSIDPRAAVWNNDVNNGGYN